MFTRIKARSQNARGNALSDKGDQDGSEACYRRAVELDDSYEPAWFNLGLVYKRRRAWQDCLRCNARAAQLVPRKEQPAWWNLGIAATALHDWKTARIAWRRYGIELTDGDGPIELD
jgi:tetratricopeptide (TPR) repeat protein